MRRNYNFRRHQARRKEQHAYWVVTSCWNVKKGSAKRMARRLRDNLAVCSCQMCRNARRGTFGNGEEKLTMQERRALVEDKEIGPMV